MPEIVSVASAAESLLIAQQFRATGVAQVIVVLKTPILTPAATAVQPAGVPPNLRKHFVQSDMTRDSAIRAAMAGGESRAALSRFARRSAAAAPLVRTYPNLGVMLGNVTTEGLERLRRDERVAAVTGFGLALFVHAKSWRSRLPRRLPGASRSSK